MRARRFASFSLFFTLAIKLSGAATARAQTFPVDSAWIAVTRGGSILTDPSGDSSVSAPARDVLGCTGANAPCVGVDSPAAFVASDSSFLYLRIRVVGNPGSTSFAWGAQLSTDGNASGYEVMALLDRGTTPSVGVEVWYNTVKTNSPSDTAEALHSQYSTSTHSVIAATALGYFVSIAIPWSDIPGGCGAPIRFIFGANSSGNPSLITGLSGDIAGDTGLSTWSQIASDTIVFDAESPLVTVPGDVTTEQTTCS